MALVALHNTKSKAGLLQLLVAVSVLLFSASPARAHLVDMRFGDFYGGALHLITGVQYALLLLTLSLLAGTQPVTIARWALLIVPSGVALGALVAVFMPSITVTLMLTISLLGVGLVIAAGKQLPHAAFIALIAFPSLLLGYENGIAANAAQDTHLFLAGLALTAFVSVCLLAAAFIALKPVGGWTSIAFRAVGSWMAAVSLIFIALNFASPATPDASNQAADLSPKSVS